MIVLLKNKLKEKKGLNSIQLAIGVLILSFLYAGISDAVNVSNRMQSLSSAMTYISKVVSNQGCLTNNPESVYVSATGERLYNIDYIKNKKYVTASELYNAILNIMTSDGIPTSDWKVTVGGVNLSPTMKTPLYDFRERIPVTIEINYSWDTLSSLLPISNNVLKGSFKTEQEIVSTYKIRDGSSDDGFIYGN